VCQAPESLPASVQPPVSVCYLRQEVDCGDLASPFRWQGIKLAPGITPFFTAEAFVLIAPHFIKSLKEGA
jgi:hypothetical protein